MPIFEDIFLYKGFTSQNAKPELMVEDKTLQNDYVNFCLRRSFETHYYVQKYWSFIDLFSYMGGFFSFMCLMLSFLAFYSKCCYEQDFAADIFQQKNGRSYRKDKLNFGTFVPLVIVLFFAKLKKFYLIVFPHKSQTMI